MTTIFSSGPLVDLARRQQHPLRDVDVPERAADVDVLAHRAPDERDLAVRGRGGVHDLLDAVDVRREAGDDDPALAAAEHAVQVRADDRLRLADARAVHVRGVAAQQQHALAAELGQARHVRGRAADRRLVELVVAREEHGAQRRLERDAGRVRDRVGEVDALDLERAGVDRVPDRQHLEVDLAQLVLVELRTRHGDRQLAAVDDRDLVLAEVTDDPRQRADVVLVAVGDHDRLDRVDVLAQVREVRQHEVDAHHLGRREAQAAVDDDDPAVVLDDRQVLTDFAYASEREDAQ